MIPIVVYIAGPFRAPNAWEIEQNVRRAENLALATWRAGFPTICPHTNTRFFTGAAPDDIWLEGDLEIVLRCNAVLTVSGWENSEGTRTELALAKSAYIPVFHNLHDLTKYDFFSAKTVD